VSRNIVKDAEKYATDEKGVVNLNKKQNYIDSIWNKPVYNFLGSEYTYKEVKDNELNLGLDLQGGMHVTLEVSPVDIIAGLAGNTQDSVFIKTMNLARQQQRSSNKDFSEIFFDSYRQLYPQRNLSYIFANTARHGRIKMNTSDDDVIQIVNEEIDNAVERSYTILKNRLDQFGTSSPNIQRLPGSKRIQVEIPGADNPQRVRKLLQGVAKLEFWDVMEPQLLNQNLLAINEELLKEVKTVAGKPAEAKQENLSALLGDSTKTQGDTTNADATQGLDSLQNKNVSPLFGLSNPPGAFRYALKDTAQISAIFKNPKYRNLLPRTVGVYWGNKTDAYDGGDPSLQLYFLDLGRTGKAKLTGEVIVSARQDLDEHAMPAVSMTMNTEGTRVWAKMTANAASKSPKGRIAIVLDKNVYSAPYVNGEILNGNSQISGNFLIEEAKDLANILQAGSLPAPCRIVEEAIIGPTLGQAAQQEGLLSSAFGLILIVIFMVAYYAKGGWIANIALLFNIFFILGILAQPSLGTALTLPGIAGIVLTMGMAVDANVLIYERIKEETLRGRSLIDAINTGYKRAFAAIFDSNLTALITGVFLFIFGQGPIKGFATTLIIGIVTSFFTAIYISRVLIEWMVKRVDPSKVSFDTVISKLVKKRRYFDFVGKSKRVYTISSAVVVAGFILLAINGFNYGVDFSGGRSYVVEFSRPVVATDMKVALSGSFEEKGTEVKNYGANNIVKVTTSYKTEDNSEEADEQVRTALIKGVEEFTKLKYSDPNQPVDDQHFTVSSSSKVGATVADDIKSSAWQASIFSLIGIFFYILIRFVKWQYSLGAILATIHDTLFVIAAFAIADALGISFEIDQIFVASILTIIGYSINDTVIIFDRIREYIAMGISHDKTRIVNDAVNDTLSRTIITSGTTLVVVLVLLIFGGEVLRGFSFALLIGVIVGTYSSIYIATPVLLDSGKKGKDETAVAGNKSSSTVDKPLAKSKA
jgi:SecD/SecF fusion protein